MSADTILHCFAGKRWSGDATSALNSAIRSGGIVLTEAGERAELRLRRAGIADVRPLSMSGMFGALNLSRMLRIVRPAAVHVHSVSLLPKVRQAVGLSKLPVEIIDRSADIVLPEEVPPVDKGDKLLWIGYITTDCGLRLLLEAMKSLPPEVTLRVVGEGEAKVVGPLLNLAKTPWLRGRVEWTGEREDVYEMMNGCCAGVITSANPESKVVYHELIRAGLPVISGTLPEELINGISSL
ncbi:MAG: glycosyltransferase [Muribaculaceae bacterium]|nr:glycosyltransferase [Muribaculaceae bacterium]